MVFIELVMVLNTCIEVRSTSVNGVLEDTPISLGESSSRVYVGLKANLKAVGSACALLRGIHWSVVRHCCRVSSGSVSLGD
jgi:hypothetical protein